MSKTSKEINFTKYDVLGFDMDFTLARYELVPFFTMAYDELCKFMVSVKQYDASIFHGLEKEHDLMATHGTKKMTDSEIVAAYGEDKVFAEYENLKKGKKSQDCSWRLFENYFDIPGLVAFAKVIDYKEQKGLNLNREEYVQIWRDIFSGLEYLYTPAQFKANQGGYFPNMKAYTSKYIDKISFQVKTWLKNLRKDGRILFLLTTSFPDYANLLMNFVFGEDWKSLFDICLYGARKPIFFTDSRPFVELDGINAVQEVETMKQGVEYSGGNYSTFMSFLSDVCGKKEPKVLYFGDNLSADAWPSTQLGSWDCVLILEEMDAEGYAVSDGTVPGHNDELEDPSLPPAKRKRRFEHSSLVTTEEIELLVSQFWGSIFIDKSTDNGTNGTPDSELYMNTIFGHLVSMHSTICVPSIEYLAGIPIDHNFTTFSDEPGNTLGFHPGRPRSLLPS